ncbi:hypothetical protein RCZ04_18960 [Capnocytophaga sp. HP1101]
MENNQIPENWAVYIGRVEDKPAMFRINLGLADLALPLEGYAQCVRLNLELKHPDEHGFSSDAERTRLYDIEDAHLMPALKQSDLLAGVVTYQGNVTWFIYTQEATALVSAIEASFAKVSDYKPEIHIVDDAGWEVYTDYLYPNIYEHQGIKNDNVRRHCIESGDHTDQERPIDHWLYFDTEKDMNDALAKVQALGYQVQDSGKVVPDGDESAQEVYYHLILTKVNTVDDINGDTWDLIDVALDTNGQYDGWETVLVK